jgi:hypothetical protein
VRTQEWIASELARDTCESNFALSNGIRCALSTFLDLRAMTMRLRMESSSPKLAQMGPAHNISMEEAGIARYCRPEEVAGLVGLVRDIE